ncbi:MAG: response regulator, partial [Spirochaetes bacterium]|nr:response regulator [Spirochaetota bacterium]
TLIITPIESAIQGDYKKPVDKIFFENLQRNAARLLSLINDLLDFSKIEAGRMSIKVREVDIVKFIKALLGTVQSAAESKGVSLDFISKTDKLKIFIDTDKTEKILINLLSNALKFTEKGDRISIRLDHDRNACIIEVEDNGEGIPGDKIDLIFDRFSQVDSRSKRRFEGAGIGLALVKELVEMQGGSISVESRYIEEYPDRHGTVFRIILQKGKDHYKELDNVHFVEEAESTIVKNYIHSELIETRINSKDTRPDAAEKEHTILIVEDNADMVNLLVDLLGSYYNTLYVSNGREAIDILHSEKHDIDLILADVMMPVMDGHDLTEAIRKDARYESIPIILLTAKADISMKVEGLEKGATDYITKPFDFRELLVRIKAQIEMKRLRDRLKRSNEKLYNQLRKKKDLSGAVSDVSEEKVKIILDFINDNYDTDLTRESLAAAVDINPDHLSRVFNRYTGKKINEYINSIRIDEAKKKLEDSRYNITEIAISVGFENLRTFNRYFLSATGISPTEYRAKKLK